MNLLCCYDVSSVCVCLSTLHAREKTCGSLVMTAEWDKVCASMRVCVRVN